MDYVLDINKTDSFMELEHISTYLLLHTHYRPTVGIIFGTGISSLSDCVKNPHIFPYEKLPTFPLCSVPGHENQLVFGLLDGVPVVCMKGQFHHYEGYATWSCSIPVRVMKLVGVTHLLISNGASGLGDGYKVGDIMVIKDHINSLVGFSPLRGPNDFRFGPRFTPMNKAYDAGLRCFAKHIAEVVGIANYFHEGVYGCRGGPEYGTVAELKMLKMMGIDSVGMSTVHEVTTARHCEMKVFAFSLITNMCVTDYESLEQTNHVEVLQSAKEQEEVLKQFVTRMVKHIASFVTEV